MAVSRSCPALPADPRPSRHPQKNATLGMYALKLTIDPVQMEDQSKTFVLQLENAMGSTALEFQIGTGAAPPPEGNTAPVDADAPPGSLSTGHGVGGETNGKDELAGDSCAPGGGSLTRGSMALTNRAV